MILFIAGLFVGCILGVLIIGLVGSGARQDIEMEIHSKSKTIKDQFNQISELREEMIKYKGAAASEEQRADLLQRMKDELQEYYDELSKDYKEMVTDYKKLYIELDAIKAAEVKKFRTPEEIEALLKNEIDYDGLLNELTVIEEMLLDYQGLKVKLAV